MQGIESGKDTLGPQHRFMPPRFACPCCGYRTLPQEPPGTYELCPVCFWEDDQVQFRDPDYTGGANQPSLRQAKANFASFGAVEDRFRRQVRGPVAGEERAPDWKS